MKRYSIALLLRLALLSAAIAAWIWIAASYLFFMLHIGFLGSLLLGVAVAVLSSEAPVPYLILLLLPALGLLFHVEFFADFSLA